MTISPLAMWVISWARTPFKSLSLMRAIRPVETATSERLLVGPVANALGSFELNIPTCGMVESPASLARK